MIEESTKEARLPSRTLAILALCGLLLHGAILAQNFAQNPLSRVLVVDAEVYWEWAGAVSRGRMLGDAPFFGAPLYPYLLGLLRALGGGLLTAYLVQLVLHVGTGLLIARVGTRLFGTRGGVLAGALWLLSAGPAYYAGRLLACILQVFLITWLLDASLALRERVSRPRLLGLGLLLGACCLAWPPALAAVPVVGIWTALVTGRGARGLRCGAGVVAAAVVAISPATIHNRLASGEWIPISAHGGITFYHGNNESADGTFSPLGVANDKRVHDSDALEQAREARGPEIGWREASDHFMGLGLDWWRANPGQAATLALKKFWWTLSGRVYGDMYLPRLEREDDLTPMLWLAPLPLAWWTLPACLALLILLRRGTLEYVPLALALVLPFAICVAFFYSPRYRMPAAPALVLLGAWTLLQIIDYRRAPRVAAALGLALLVSVSSGLINGAVGLDRRGKYRPDYELRMGDVFATRGEHEIARTYFRRAQEHRPSAGALRLAELLRQEGQLDQALETLGLLVASRPADGDAQRAYATTLAQSGRPDLALEPYSRAVALDSNDWQAELGWGTALVQVQRPGEARDHLRRALVIHPGAPDAHYLLGFALEALGSTQEGLDAWRQELARDPGHVRAAVALAQRLVRSGEEGAARAVLATVGEYVGAPAVAQAVGRDPALVPLLPSGN